jgi:hypothetical protein
MKPAVRLNLKLCFVAAKAPKQHSEFFLVLPQVVEKRSSALALEFTY